MGSNVPVRENISSEQPIMRTSFPAESSDWVRETLEKIDDLDPERKKAQEVPSTQVEEPRVRYSLKWDDDLEIFIKW